MAWWIQTLETADKDGKPTGKYRRTATSDEDGGGPFGLCEHRHNTAEAAEKCPDAKREAKRY